MQFSTQLSQFSRINDSPDDLHASDVHSRSPYLSSSHLDSTSPRPSSIASTLDDILLPGDYVAEGGLLQGEPIRRVSLGSSPPASLEGDCTNQPHSTFQVVRRLGTGSYAVVYLVREVFLAPSSSSSGEGSIFGSMDVGGPPVPSRPHSVVYGHEYAIKCLSKADLDEDQLNAQMSEVKIHQSLHSHPNIVTLHRTLETASFLLLLMEYVPGEDLFYFLEQARDHFDIPPQPDDASMASNTPPTPCLLSTLHPSQLLSRTRLRLVASMFAQMCEAVAAAHAQGVYHRDIKPENFIVTDGFVERPDRSRERKVFVKLTDFGLGTTDRDSGDMDCGSAPYISYECRNNVAPSYRTDAADVWSLGIVLINMLYHHNPWTDTSQGVCGSFSLYRSDPVKFFMTRFAGMNRVVAEFLTTKIFCILEDGKGPTGTYRVSAHEFGLWVHGLPDLFAPGPAEAVNKRHQRILSTASIDHPVSSWSQVSHRPDSRNPSINAAVRCTPTIRSRSVSRAPSAVDLYDRQDLSELSISLDQTIEESFSQKHLPLPEDVLDHTILETVSPDDSPSPSRSASVNHSRKRSRKGKGTFTTVRPTPTTLDLLAEASQSLARELSSKSRPPSVLSGTSSRHRLRKASNEPVSLLPAPMVVPSSNPMEPPPLLALATSLSRPKPVTQSPSPALPAIATKKPPKWKLSIGRTSGAPASRSPAGSSHSQTLGRFGPTHPNTPDTPLPSFTNATFSGPDHSSEDWTPFESNRSRSPQSTRGGKSPSIASSSASANWSSSRSTTSSAFTSYSNGSLRSVSTAATSVSGQSWRNKDNASINSSNSGNSSHYHPSHPNIPRNIRIMTGVPEELITLPHDPYGPSRGRRPRTKKPKDNPLGTINEPAGLSSPDGQRSPNIFDEEGGSPPGDGKPKNRQINTLARLLSGLHRNRN
ncbi:hypothetical protein DL96DRAFT_1532556 [Flagelloscypha sp. PMI_526]|nr:hypothetical protein DL96DRAFT_1532556 [Flagelloscypha sp. PMI_526]